MRDITKKYTNGEATVIWKPTVCIHSGVCFRGLGEVFDPRRVPWIEMGNSDTAKIIHQVKQCPSGALSFVLNSDLPQEGVDTQII